MSERVAEQTQAQKPDDRLLGTIVIPWDPNDYNPNRVSRGHWSSAARAKKAGTQLALYYWRINRFVADYRIEVSVTVCRGRRLDADNCITGLKPVFDGLFNRNRHDGDGVVPEDGHGWVEYRPVVQETGGCWAGKEEVVVEIRKAEDQAPLKNAPPLRLHRSSR